MWWWSPEALVEIRQDKEEVVKAEMFGWWSDERISRQRRVVCGSPDCSSPLPDPGTRKDSLAAPVDSSRPDQNPERIN